jgi:hypothetical protein
MSRHPRFYRESFGFTETFRTPQHGRPINVELRRGQFTLGLAAIDSLREMFSGETSPVMGLLYGWRERNCSRARREPHYGRSRSSRYGVSG